MNHLTELPYKVEPRETRRETNKLKNMMHTQKVMFGYTVNADMRDMKNAGKTVKEIAEYFGADVEDVKVVVNSKRIAVGINDFVYENEAI